MKKYYLHEENGQTGPFDIADLKAKNIQKDTSLWYEGLTEWTEAGKVDELKELFSQSTPPLLGSKKGVFPKTSTTSC
ncbi:MAG: DUF4339 domain-containing protein [Bacteroidetes bacterium]|nr:DUF4339 domain-containing protein [Bacteroidota bacterium]